MLAANIIIPYDGSHASIPAGFTRETSLDGKYLKGAADSTDPNTTGGSATHTHTSPNHSHTMQAHSHSIGTSNDFNSSFVGSGQNATSANDGHSHSSSVSGFTGGTTSASITFGAVSNDPPFYTVIFIKSSTYNRIPENGIVLSANTTRPGLLFHSASADRFLKGANAEQNAGSTGGTTTNTHDISHSHAGVSHSHSGSIAGSNGKTRDLGVGDGAAKAASDHTHSVVLNSTSQTPSSHTGTYETSETVQPAFRTLNPFIASVQTLPRPGDIAMWLGSLASIPVGWKVCDGTNSTPDMRDRFLKIPNTASTSTTGGSHSHAHEAGGSHSHTGASHSHSVSSISAHTNNTGGTMDTSKSAIANHTHSVSSVGSSTTTWNASTVAADSSDNQPEYRTVAYIKLNTPAATGQPLVALLENTRTY